MSWYVSIQGIPPQVILNAYRGDDVNNTLTNPIPPDEHAIYRGQFNLNYDRSQVHNELGNFLAIPAMRSPNTWFLVRVEDDNRITIWNVIQP